MLVGLPSRRESLASIFEALKEKLGLLLDISRGPIEVLTIDHADRVPTGN